MAILDNLSDSFALSFDDFNPFKTKINLLLLCFMDATIPYPPREVCPVFNHQTQYWNIIVGFYYFV